MMSTYGVIISTYHPNFLYSCYKLGIAQGLTEKEIKEVLGFTDQRIAFYRQKLTDEIMNNYYNRK